MRWRVEVSVGGTDVSSRLTGALSIEAEEGTARIAEFTILPFTGPINLTSYVGKPVTIDYVQLDPVAAPKRLFTGVVDVPEYDPKKKTTHFRCTDDFQKKAKDLIFGPYSRFSKDVPGAIYSEAIFGVKIKRSGWHVLQDAMSTVPGSYDLDAHGASVYTPWLAKDATDFAYTASNIIDKSLTVTFATRQAIKNNVEINYQYRFNRLFQRVAYYGWQFPGVCFSIEHGGDIPTISMIDEAIATAGWDKLKATYQNPPGSGIYLCNAATGDPAVWICDESARKNLVFQADIYLTKRFSQQVTDSYFLNVSSTVSKANLGTLTSNLNGSLEAPFDTSLWEQNVRRPPYILGNGLNSLYAPPFNPLNPTVIPGTVASTESPPSVPGSPPIVLGNQPSNIGPNPLHGEYIFDKTDVATATRADSDMAVKCLIHKARAEILASHRQNFVDFTVPIEATIDRTATVTVDTPLVQAKGKVRQLTHTLDINSGSALTKVRLAISRVDALGVRDTTVDPTPPFGPPPPVPTPSESLFVVLGNTYGGLHGAATDTTYGHITNIAGDNTNPHEFRIPTFPITATDQQHQENSLLETYTLDVPDELLIVSA